ncbi:MAG: signal peptidase II [Actinobacteria bacterium]|nr:signal peptidase II [Actinomycetota bacterium]
MISDRGGAPGEIHERRRDFRRAYSTFLVTAAIVVAVDQVTKQLALGSLSGRSIDLLGEILTLRLTLNSGGAFGVLQGFPGFFMAVTLVILACIVLFVRRLDDRRLLVPLGLILGGGAGNLCDRLFRALDGRVVDFIDFHVWPVFNLADSAITIGVCLILLTSARPLNPKE